MLDRSSRDSGGNTTRSRRARWSQAAVLFSLGGLWSALIMRLVIHGMPDLTIALWVWIGLCSASGLAYMLSGYEINEESAR